MSSNQPTIKSFYKVKIFNNSSNPSTASCKRSVDSNTDHSLKIPKKLDGKYPVITLGDSNDEDLSTDEFALIRGGE